MTFDQCQTQCSLVSWKNVEIGIDQSDNSPSMSKLLSKLFSQFPWQGNSPSQQRFIEWLFDQGVNYLLQSFLVFISPQCIPIYFQIKITTSKVQSRAENINWTRFLSRRRPLIIQNQKPGRFGTKSNSNVLVLLIVAATKMALRIVVWYFHGYK